MDISFTFTTGFMGDPSDAEVSGVAYEILPTPVDEAWGIVLAPFRFWPVPYVIHLSKQRVGWRPGCNVAVVEFGFDRPVSAWTVRANSRSHVDGTEVEEWQVRVPGAESATAGTASIYDDDLLQGVNQVAIYGRGLDGTWTPPVGMAA
jgi:hypothetical protein